MRDAHTGERKLARIERFYQAMAAEIEAAGGMVEKFAGDAVIAALGAPDALEDDAKRALHASLAMQHRLATVFAASSPFGSVSTRAKSSWGRPTRLRRPRRRARPAACGVSGALERSGRCS